MRRMGDIIVQASSIPLLRSMHHNASRLNSFSEEILRIEDEADELHDQGLSALFRAHRNSDAMGFIVGAEIYGHLEKGRRWVRGCGEPGGRHRDRERLGALRWTARFLISLG
jgi:hypothetical protein